MQELNELDRDQLCQRLSACCGSQAWCRDLAEMQPFANLLDLKAKADLVFDGLQDDDWLEAFQCHPQIGDIESIKMKFAGNDRWSAAEQAGVTAADDQTIRRLAEANQEYLDRFGFIFIVCASGKSAFEMLTLLEQRLKNSPKQELEIAAIEQRKITHLRIEKL